VQRSSPTQVAPQFVEGDPSFQQPVISEWGLHYQLRFGEGYSVGLFLDQRENRWRFLTGYVGPRFRLPDLQKETPSLLNLFSYTCAFSVCAARAGWHTVNVDLSKRYLEWGKENFRLNGLDPDQHEFWHGDVWDQLRRWTKKQRQFDAVILDPPTFSRSKISGVFQTRRDYGRLVAAALQVVRPGGVVLACCNTVGFGIKDFLRQIEEGVAAAGRQILQKQYTTQPPDFPTSSAEPAYLKCLWFRVK